MLKPGRLYKAELNELMMLAGEDINYKYYFGTDRQTEFVIDNDKQIYYVSIHNGIIKGYIAYTMGNMVNQVMQFSAVNFYLDDKSYTNVFANDLKKVIRDIFELYNFNRLEFNVVVGNPVEKYYDRLVKHYGGIIAGYYRQTVMLADHLIYDEKIYEIMREDYLKAKESRGNKDEQSI